MTNPPDEPQIHTEILGSPLMADGDRDEPPTDTFHQDLIDETAWGGDSGTAPTGVIVPKMAQNGGSLIRGD